MTEDELPKDVAELARSLSSLQAWASANTPRSESPARAMLRKHFDADPAGLPIVSETLSPYERPNLQVALDSFFESGRREFAVHGFAVPPGHRIGLAAMASRRNPFGGQLEPGPVEHVTVRVGEQEIVCLASALLLISDDGRRSAAFLRHDEMHGRKGLQFEVMATERDDATALIDALRLLMHTHNVYRGRVVEVGSSAFGDSPVKVRSLPTISRRDIVLPDGVLERIERQTIGFDRHREELHAHGMHLKRGLLLHGPPGTGKTLCAMYLAGEMPRRTTLLLTGQALGAIAASCDMARRLQPATVVIEDVDLVAMERSHSANTNALLFELLNQMEGLQDDSDVIFVLTTNRADILEPGLAQRPGRIDEAVELPLPDRSGRQRLFDLYGRRIGLEIDGDSDLIERTEGVSAAFIRELMRRATLLAAMSTSGAKPTDEHLRQAVAELEDAHAGLTRRLLGAKNDATQ
jgi:hypothetical protein